jgi:AcrR family transcriptional regulator
MITPTETDDALGQRVVDAALVVIGRFGLAKLTLEDVAKEAGCSRATLYRRFPGKGALLEAVVASEARRLRAGLADALAEVATLEEALAAVAAFGEGEWSSHAALQFLLAHEPGVVLPALTFQGAERTLGLVADAIAPALSRFLPTMRARRMAQWLARIVLSYGCTPAEGRSGAAVGATQTFVVPALPVFDEREVPNAS